MSRRNRNKNKNRTAKKNKQPSQVICSLSKKRAVHLRFLRCISLAIWLWASRLLRVSKWLYLTGFLIILSPILSLALFGPSFSGQTSVVPHESTSSTRSFDIPFTITNSSVFKIVNVRTYCRVLEATIGHLMLKDMIMGSNQHSLPNYLMPQQQMREKCSFLIRPSYSSEITSAYIEFQVGFEPSLIPWKYEMLNRFIFRMEHLPTGEQRWIPEPSYPDR